MNQRRLALAADAFAVIVVVSVAVAGARLSWRLAGDPRTTLAATPDAMAIAPPLDLAPVIAFAPFGSAVAMVGEVAQPLELHGILLAQPRTRSSVLLSVGGAPVKAYAIGASVGGATIAGIELDHVLLRSPTGDQRLDYPNRAAGAIATGTIASPSPAVGSPSGVDAIRALIPPAVRGTSGALAPGADRTFLDSIGATPTTGGYRIGAGLSPAMQAAGLRPGDLIERVNGSGVGAVAGDGRVLASAIASGAALVDIVRDGRRMSLSLPLR